MNDLNLISGLAAIPASVVIIYLAWKFGPAILLLLAKKSGDGGKNFGLLNEKIDIITNNHLHEVTDALRRIEDSLDRMNDNMTRNNGEIKESLAYLKAKMNGK